MRTIGRERNALGGLIVSIVSVSGTSLDPKTDHNRPVVMCVNAEHPMHFTSSSPLPYHIDRLVMKPEATFSVEDDVCIGPACD